jgi:hypothetical protein
MGIPDPNVDRYLISSARERATELLAAFTAAHTPEEETDALCSRVGVFFDEYCGGLLAALRNAVQSLDAAEAAWVRDHYIPLIVNFATALRDSITDRNARHAAAQLIQCKVLEHERHLRLVLESHATQELASATPATPDSANASREELIPDESRHC